MSTAQRCTASHSAGCMGFVQPGLAKRHGHLPRSRSSLRGTRVCIDVYADMYGCVSSCHPTCLQHWVHASNVPSNVYTSNGEPCGGHWPCTAHDKQLTDEGRQRIFTRRMSGPVSAHWHGHVFSACVWLMSMSVQVVRNTHGGTACVLLHGPCVASARSSQVSKNVIPRGLGNHG